MVILSKTNLHRASTQWSSRPADERFWDLPELIAATKAIDASRKATVAPVAKLRATWDEGTGLRLEAPGLAPTPMTHWAFSLMAARLGAPARYLRSLPGEIVANLVNHGLSDGAWESKHDVRLSVRGNKDAHVEAFTSSRYGYIPNYKIGEGLQALTTLGWRVPPARPSGNSGERTRKATKDDILGNNKLGGGLNVKLGDLIAPAGIYASDKDLFCFLVHEKSAIDAGGFHLNRGIFVENSEVGAGSFRITTFLYDAVCGNHIVWGATNVNEISVRHIGKAEPRAALAMESDLNEYLNADVKKSAKLIQVAQKTFLGKSRAEVVEKVYAHRRTHMSQDNAGRAFDLAEKLDADRVDPTSVWGMVTGVTRLSQEMENADERTRLDGACEALMAMVA
jgi:hypothetical protein